MLIDPALIDPVLIDLAMGIVATTSKTDVTTSTPIGVVTASMTDRIVVATPATFAMIGSIAVINTWTTTPVASRTGKSGATIDTNAATTCTIT